MQNFNPSLFNTIPTQSYVNFYDPKNHFMPKEVPKFLGFKKEDVAKAVDVPLSSVRYDDKIPQIMYDRLIEIANVIELVAGYFGGDLTKTALWFKISNPMLGNISPRDMIRYGRYKKLHAFISNSLAGI